MKNFLFTLLLLAGACMLQAQSPAEFRKNPELRAARMTAEMKTHLQLSQSQTDTLAELNLQYARRIQEEVIDTQLNSWQQYWKSQSINKEKEKILRRLLTKEQYKSYEKMRSEAMQKMRSQTGR